MIMSRRTSSGTIRNTRIGCRTHFVAGIDFHINIRVFHATSLLALSSEVDCPLNREKSAGAYQEDPLVLTQMSPRHFGVLHVRSRGHQLQMRCGEGRHLAFAVLKARYPP